MSPLVVVLGSSACKDASDSDVVRGEIGPSGGLLSSADSILTIAIQPGALDETIELVIERSGEPPDVYGPAFRVEPNLALNIPSTVTYRYPLPDDTSETAVGYVDADEFVSGNGRWRPLPVVRLDAAQKLVTAIDTKISLYYGLLDDDLGLPGDGTADGTDDDTTATPTTTTATTTTATATTTTTDTSASATTVDPDTSAGTTDTGEESSGETTGTPMGCAALPAPPLAVDEFMFAGTPLLDSEDMTFTANGSIIARDGPELVEISPAGAVTTIPTMVALPEPTLGTRWTPAGTVVTAGQFTGELLEIQPDGSVAVLVNMLGIPNGVFVALDGTIFFTEFTGQRASWVDPNGGMLTVLGQGGDDAPSTNGIVYDPDRDLVFYVSYYAGIIYRVDVTDLANPGDPQMIATIPSLGGADAVGLDGVALDVCGNLYVVDQNQDAPGSLYRLQLDAAGAPTGAPEVLVEAFPAGVANVVFAQGPGWEAFDTTVFTIGLPGRIFMVDVGVPGAPTPAGG